MTLGRSTFLLTIMDEARFSANCEPQCAQRNEQQTQIKCMTHVEQTDPAMELSELLRTLLSIPSSNKPTWSVLSKAFSLDASTEAYNDLVTAVLARVSGLRSIAQSMAGSQRLLERAARVGHTADTLTHIFLPSGQAAPWAESLARLSLSDGMNLAGFSPEARAVRPLRVIDLEERDAFLEKVNETIAEIGAEDEIDLWIRGALLREALRLRTTLQHIEYFGHEYAAERTAIMAMKVQEAAAKTSKSRRLNLGKTLRLILDLSAAFIVVHDVKEAGQDYLAWAKHFVPEVPSNVLDNDGNNENPTSSESPPPLAETQKA